MRKVYIAMLAIGLMAGAPWALSQAVWSDSQDVDANTFATGSVDLSTSPTTALVTYSSMAPGDATTQSITVSNDGTMQLRYAISSSATNTDTKALKDGLTLTIKTQDVVAVPDPCDDFDGTTLYTGDLDSTAGKLVGDAAQGSHSGDRTLAASASEVLCFRVSLPSNAANSLQSATTTATFTFAAEQTASNP